MNRDRAPTPGMPGTIEKLFLAQLCPGGNIVDPGHTVNLTVTTNYSGT